MSLVLEALRKLEREKGTPERSLVVTGASDWARAEERPGRRLAWGLGAVLAAGAAFFVWRGSTAHAPAAATGGAAPPAPRASVGAWAGATAPPAAPVAAVPAPAAPPVAAPRLTAPLPVSVPAPARAVAPSPVPRQPAAAPLDEGVPAAESAPERGETAASAEVPPADSPAAAPGDVVLQVITERDGQPIAIVNGRLVRQGDSFDGIRILRIGAAEIEVEVDGRRRTVGF